MPEKEKDEHYCDNPDVFPTNKMFKPGKGRGRRVLIVGQWPAANGWRKSGEAFRTPDGEMIQSGKNLNKLLEPVGLSLENCAYTDIVKCYRAEGKPPTSKCKRGCWPIFERQLRSDDFGLLILLGPPVWETIRKKAGTVLHLGKLARVRLSGSHYTVLPIYHPVHQYQDSARANRQTFKELGNELRTLLAQLENASGGANPN